MQAIKTIKMLVLFMGLLLIAGLALLGYGLYSKAGQTGKTQSRPIFSQQDFNVVIPVPAGSQILDMDSSAERVLLRISSSDGEKILVLDPHAGRVVGSFSVQPEAPSLPVR